MEKIELLVFLTLKGIGSSSGIVSNNNSLFIISDNSSYLYEYNRREDNLNRIALIENPTENTPKKDKLDLESITLKGKELYLFGSGSKEKRNKSFSYHLDTKEVKTKDLSPLYNSIKEKLKIASDELNIEGALFHDKDLLLFQRGNGAASKNGIIKVSNFNDDNYRLEFVAMQLPKVKNVEFTFTDAILVKDKIYFLAAAEDTNSTYNDGEVLGSIIGSIDSKTLALEKTVKISDKHKFEGLTLYKSTPKELEFLLCEDNDTEELKTTIYKLNYAKFN